MIVQFCHGNFACLHSLLELLTEKNIFRLFMIEPGSGSFFRAVRPAPVGKHEAFEIPILLEDIRQQIFVFAGIVTVDGIVRTHHAGGIGNLNANLESQ